MKNCRQNLRFTNVIFLHKEYILLSVRQLEQGHITLSSLGLNDLKLSFSLLERLVFFWFALNSRVALAWHQEEAWGVSQGFSCLVGN